jgi:outer membrane receptor protein involved in Fe transport
LPPDHWSYPAFERFEALGLLEIPSIKPFSRDQAIQFSVEIQRRVAESDFALSKRDRFNLDRLVKEFEDAASRRDPKKRYDPPLLYASDPPLSIEGDADVAVSFERAFFSEDNNVFATSYPSFKLHLGDRATYDVRYRLIFGPERGERARDNKPSPREKSFKGLTSLFERSYVNVHFSHADVYLGREYVEWGPSPISNLHVSGTGGSFDLIGANLHFRNVRLQFFHALLSPSVNRYLTGHRLEARFGRLLVGVSESVLYAGKGFDPIYALPLCSFYSNQFNERGDDNILWALDAKYSVFTSIVLYGSILIDDFQFERGDGTPDKLAFDVGATIAASDPLPVDLQARYRRVDLYTYTHRDSLNAHVARTGELDRGEPLIAGAPGPDSDEWMVGLNVYPRADVTATLRFDVVRLGEGNDFRKWVRPMDPSPPFPLGVVERTIRVGASLTWELAGNSRISVSFSRAFVENQDHISGRDDNSSEFRAAGSLDL